MKEFTRFFDCKSKQTFLFCKIIRTFFVSKRIFYDYLRNHRLRGGYITKKLIVSRQPILINLKSNTMKNTVQK